MNELERLRHNLRWLIDRSQTQRDVATKAGVSLSHLNGWINHGGNMGVEKVARIVEAIGYPLGTLVSRDLWRELDPSVVEVRSLHESAHDVPVERSETSAKAYPSGQDSVLAGDSPAHAATPADAAAPRPFDAAPDELVLDTYTHVVRARDRLADLEALLARLLTGAGADRSAKGARRAKSTGRRKSRHAR